MNSITLNKALLSVITQSTTQATCGVSQMIKNEQNFSCQSFDLTYKENIDLKMPTAQEATDFLKNLFEQSFKYKPLNQKALASMKLKGITPKKQAKELVLIMITASEKAAHMGIWLPDHFRTQYDLHKMIELTCKGFNGITMTLYNNGQLIIVDCPCETPFKRKDDLQQQAFTMLKSVGIYQDNNDDDDETNMMTINDL